MKAGRRHELRTNELADWALHQYEKHRSRLPTLMWGAVAIAAVIVLISVWSSRRVSSVASAWEEFYQISSLEPKDRSRRLKELANRFPNSEIALWARLDLADLLCYEGYQKLDINREIATNNLREAQQIYASVLQDPEALAEMTRRAALAEAKCWELLGEREKAITAYRSAAKRFEARNPDLASDAASRASDLELPEAADFYKWLAEYKPPTSPPLTLPGIGSFPPLGDEPDAKTPDPNGPTPNEPPLESKESERDKPDEESAASEKESDGDKPAPQPSASDRPADTDTFTQPEAEKKPSESAEPN